MFMQMRMLNNSLKLFLLFACTSKGLISAVPVEQPEISAAAASSSTVNATDAIGRVMYDQRQSGKYNIHVSIKDVAIIEMDQKEQDDEVYDDTDYYYDEADLTVKPLTLSITTVKGVTMNILNNASKMSTTTPSTVQTEILTTNLPTVPLITDIATVAATTLLADGDEQNATRADLQISTISTPTQLVKESRNEEQLRMPESTIYKFKMPQQQEHVEKLKEKLKQQFLLQNKAIPQRNAVQQEPLIKHILQQQSKQLVSSFQKQNQAPLQHSHLNVRYPTPLHVLHAHRCRTNQYRDLSGNCQNRRTSSSSNSASSILKTLFNMLVALPLANMRERD